MRWGAYLASGVFWWEDRREAVVVDGDRGDHRVLQAQFRRRRFGHSRPPAAPAVRVNS